MDSTDIRNVVATLTRHGINTRTPRAGVVEALEVGTQLTPNGPVPYEEWIEITSHRHAMAWLGY